MPNLGKKDYEVVKWVLRYLRGTTSIGLKYGAGKETGAQLLGYVDSNYVGDLDTRRSLTRYIFKICGNTIS